MSRKTAIWIFMTVGSTIGGFIPSLWNPSPFSFASVLLGGIGGFIGIYIGFKLSQ